MNELVAARKADLRSDVILFRIHPGLMQIDYTKPHRVRVSGQNIFSSLFFFPLLFSVLAGFPDFSKPL